MKILALEFSSQLRSIAAVWPTKDGPGAGTRPIPEPQIALPARLPQAAGCQFAETISKTTDAFAMMDEVLREAKWEREQVECIVVGLGPGSYTGIRAAIALAQGWRLAREVRIAGISSAVALASQGHADGLRGLVSVVIDAQRNELYAARYDLAESGLREVEPIRLAEIGEVRQREASGDVLMGPDVTRWFPSGRIMFPRAAALGALAMHRTDYLTAEKLTPIYLRESAFVKVQQRGGGLAGADPAPGEQFH